jgi:tetratricopeptide (TPR) repeat protein/GTPase SAR1 family protein
MFEQERTRMTLWSRLERRLTDLADELVLDDYREQLTTARAALSAGDAGGAAEQLDAMLRLKPDHGQAWILLGEARLALRQPSAALAAFERSLALRGKDPAGLVGHGLALLALGQLREAIVPLGRAVGEAAGDRAVLADAYRALGTAWRRLGDTDKAIRELRKAVAEDPGDQEARAALAEALVADGGPLDEASRHLERAAASPPLPLAALALGKMALAEGGPALAGSHFRDARVAVEPDGTPLGRLILLDALIGQGDAALANRDAMAAHGFYLEALQIDPRRAALHAHLAAAHRAIGNHDAALDSYQRALALGGGLPILRDALDLSIVANDTARQTQWANDLLEKEPDDPRALVARGLGLAAAGQPEAARSLLTLAAASGDLDARFGLARLLVATEPAAAVEQTLRALRTAPHHAFGRKVLEEARTQLFPPLPPPPLDIDDVARALEHAVASRPELGHLVGEISRATSALDQPLLVTVMGEFSSGKSSFVNAFIGAEVAPTGITPTTATINVVRYGRERCGRLIGRDGSVRELTWEALFPHLRALTPEAARSLDRVEILLPLPQLEKINIVDTPGLNSIQPEHEATARAFIARADAVVWVFTANQGGKASERKALTSIRGEGKRVLGALNKADQLSPSDLEEVTAFISSSLEDLVEVVVPFSARLALAHKLSGATDIAPSSAAKATGASAKPSAGNTGAAPTGSSGATSAGAAPTGAALTGASSIAATSTAATSTAATSTAATSTAATSTAATSTAATSAGATSTGVDGNWAALEGALEERFFAQARQLKRQACARRLRAVVAEASTGLDAARARADEAAEVARRGRDTLAESTRTFLKTTILSERRALSEAVTALYRRAAREVIELVQPRRLPFSAHSATTADRDYLIALLEAGYDTAIEESRHRVTRELASRSAVLQDAAAALGAAAAADVREDLSRLAQDKIQLATAQVFDRARAYLRGFLEGGYVEAFFRNDVPRLELSEDAVYHALVRGAPDLDRDINAPLSRAAAEVLSSLARRLEYWSGVVEIGELDLQVGLGRTLGDISAHLVD